MNTLGIKLSWACMVAFAFSGIIGFIPNPIIGPDAVFVTNTAHNLVHLITALGFSIVALMGNTSSIRFMLVFGVTYLIVGLLGFVVTMDNSHGMLLGFIHINSLDNFLHLGLGAVILISGYVAKTAVEMQNRYQSSVSTVAGS